MPNKVHGHHLRTSTKERFVQCHDQPGTNARGRDSHVQRLLPIERDETWFIHWEG